MTVAALEGVYDVTVASSLELAVRDIEGKNCAIVHVCLHSRRENLQLISESDAVNITLVCAQLSCYVTLFL